MYDREHGSKFDPDRQTWQRLLQHSAGTLAPPLSTSLGTMVLHDPGLDERVHLARMMRNGFTRNGLSGSSKITEAVPERFDKAVWYGVDNTHGVIGRGGVLVTAAYDCLAMAMTSVGGDGNILTFFHRDADAGYSLELIQEHVHAYHSGKSEVNFAVVGGAASSIGGPASRASVAGVSPENIRDLILEQSPGARIGTPGVLLTDPNEYRSAVINALNHPDSANQNPIKSHAIFADTNFPREILVAEDSYSPLKYLEMLALALR
jgi:hypothetical protein